MINAETSANLSTVERTSHHTTPNRARPASPAGWPDRAG